MPKWYEYLTGTPDRKKKIPTMAPYQEQDFRNRVENPIEGNATYQAGNSYLQNILSGNPEAFKAFENPLIEQFQNQIVPMIAERFGGATGSMSNSGLNNSLAQAGRGLQTDIANVRGNMQMNAAQQALPYAQQPYSNTLAQSQVPTFAYTNQQGNQGLIGGAANAFAQGAGTGIGMGPLSNYFSFMSSGSKPQSQVGF